MECFHQLIARRALASAVSRWHLEASARRGRRQEAVHLLGSLLLRKCLLALADNATSAAILRRLLEKCRMRALRDGLEAWKRWFLLSKENQQERLKAEAAAAVRDGDVCHASSGKPEGRHPGKPRKAHCRCVYAVCRGQRCTCAPRSHLLRRVEELHRLVAKGLDGRDGGYRLLSHIVQGTDVPPVDRVRSSGQPSSPHRNVSVSDGQCGKANLEDRQGYIANPRAQLLGGGAWSDTTPTARTCTRGSLSVAEGTESYRGWCAAEFGGSAGQHALLVEGQMDALVGASSPSIVASGPRCVRVLVSPHMFDVWIADLRACRRLLPTRACNW